MSVPKPWPARRPILFLGLAVLAWAMAALYLVVGLTDEEPGVRRWGFVVLWAALGGGWFWSWRRKVRAFERRAEP